ncbi:MAG: glycoside hydrolase family 3 N-terminal domain-containing protein, partial [Ktedonobacterales bacterium]
MASDPVSELPTQRLMAMDMPAAPQAPSIADLPTQRLAAQRLPGRSPRWLRRIPDPRTPGGRLAYALFTFLLLVTLSIPLLRQVALTQHPLVHTPTSVPSGAVATPGQGGSTVPVLGWLDGATSAAELRYVNSLIGHMSLDEEIGQMIMIEFQESAMTSGLAYEINHYHVGSVILYGYNVLTADQTKQFTQAMQANATLPLMISTDQEGGLVNRLQSIDGYFPSAEQIGATNDPSVAMRRGQQDAQNLLALGINTNLAPVVDVRNIPDGEGALGGRMFGTTPDLVSKMAGAYLTGLQQTHRVVGTLKHFPGLGDVPVDPHLTLPTLDRSLSDLQTIDWAPYSSLIATGQVQMVMVTHEVVPAVDPTLPSSLSEPLVTGVLRDQLHFNGVIVTD